MNFDLFGSSTQIVGPASAVEPQFKTTIEAALGMKAIKPGEFERVVVDSTVQEKAIAQPTDCRLRDVAR